MCWNSFANTGTVAAFLLANILRQQIFAAAFCCHQPSSIRFGLTSTSALVVASSTEFTLAAAFCCHQLTSIRFGLTSISRRCFQQRDYISRVQHSSVISRLRLGLTSISRCCFQHRDNIGHSILSLCCHRFVSLHRLGLTFISGLVVAFSTEIT